MAFYISSILFVFETFHRNFSIPRTHIGPKGLNSLEIIKEKIPQYFFKRTKNTSILHGTAFTLFEWLKIRADAQKNIFEKPLSKRILWKQQR